MADAHKPEGDSQYQHNHATLNTMYNLEHYNDSDSKRLEGICPFEGLVRAADVRSDDVQSVLRRAIGYIDDHIADSIRIEDVASAVGATVRTLQRYFEKYYRATPTDVIKTIRLSKVRQEIMKVGDQKGQITRLAMDYGFSHLGRFSQEYSNAFGETPSATMKNLRSSNRMQEAA